MIKRLQLFIILLVVSLSYSYAQQVGDVCTNPSIANLCGTNSFSALTSNFNNDVSSWTVGTQTITASGQDIFYQINVPDTPYQPVNLYASLAGYFPNCYACSGTIYFLWFENSPCSSNPVAVNSYTISGSSVLPDSILSSYSVSNAQTKYYLVIDFAGSISYQYSLQLGLLNSQTLPPINCSVAPPPYKGLLELDTLKCYTSANPYHLLLSEMHDDPSDSNILIPGTLNQKLTYLPIGDDNGNGFVLSIKSNNTQNELYNSFDIFPYTYPTSQMLSYTYDIAFTVFFKNISGSSGLKGFRIQVPGSSNSNNNDYPKGSGLYDPTGTWNVYYDSNSSTYTWLFNSSTGRGDNKNDSGYTCKVYTFDCQVENLGNTIEAWYLSDNYGTDSVQCSYNLSDSIRTDCGFLSRSNKVQSWIELGGGSSVGGSEGGINGQECDGIVVSYDVGPIFLPCGGNVESPAPTTTYDGNGCLYETDYYQNFETYNFTFNDSKISINQWYNSNVVSDSGGICDGKPYELLLAGNGYYNYNSYYPNYGPVNPSIIAYYDSTTGIYRPVDANGNINFSEDCLNLSIPSGFPVYPQTGSTFTVPLSVPGIYTILYTIADFNYYTGDFEGYEIPPSYYYCNAGNLIIRNDNYSKLTFSPATNSTICAGQVIQASAPGTVTYIWNPDSSVAGANELHPIITTTYTTVGIDVYGCSSDITDYIVNVEICRPKANFYASMGNSCTTKCSSFLDESVNAPTSWEWSFPGGTPSSFTGQKPPQICYPKTGLYVAKLVVSNSAGIDSITQYIQVGTCVTLPVFRESDTIICKGACITIYNQTPLNNSIYTYFYWSFPGGMPSSRLSGGYNDSFSVCYKDTGTYLVKVVTVDYFGSESGTDTLIHKIHVIYCSPVALFNFQDSICNINCVTFTNTSTNNPTSWQWSFPGGTPSSYIGESPPAVCYSNPGNYAVSLIVSDGTVSDTATHNIVIMGCPPIATLTVSDTVCATQCITVTDSSSINATSWLWSFPGGTPSFYNGNIPPAVCYSQPGNYSISLIVSNSFGNDTVSKIIEVKDCFPHALFASADSVCNNNCITIADSSSSNVLSWQWSFPGGIPGSFNGKTPPNVCYDTIGNYIIQLIATNLFGSDTTTKTIVVNNCTPKASFSANDTICVTDCIAIADSSSANVTTYLWAFNGGTPSTFNGQAPPNICYSSQGNYTIRLIVSNSSGSDTTIKTIVVNNCNPKATFKANDTICATDCIAITDSSSANVTAYSWVFNGGMPSTYSGQNPTSVCYNSPGNYSIQLIVGNKYGDDTATKTITVNNCRPVATFSTNDSICKTDCISITGSSSGNVTQWQWFFRGGNPSAFSGQTPPTVCYDNVGNYVIELIASNKYGSDTISQPINVKDCSPRTGINGPDSICAGNCITYLNESSVNSTAWQWSFAGGSPSDYTGQNPPAVCYQNGGQYIVQLIASNNYNSDTAYKTINVFNPVAGSITAFYNAFCEGTSPTLNLINSSGSVQWQVSDTTFNFSNISNDTGNVCHIPALSRDLYVRVISRSGNCTDTSAIFKVDVFLPIAINYNWKDSGLSVIFNSILDSLKNINYSWNFGDGDTSGSANPVHYFPKDSSYYVCLSVYETGYENCTYTYCQYLNVGISAVANISGQNSIQVYPDPFNNYLLVKADGKLIKSIELYDMLGRQIINKEIGAGYSTDNVIRLDVSNLIDGMYYVRVKTDSADYIQNVVKFK